MFSTQGFNYIYQKIRGCHFWLHLCNNHSTISVLSISHLKPPERVQLVQDFIHVDSADGAAVIGVFVIPFVVCRARSEVLESVHHCPHLQTFQETQAFHFQLNPSFLIHLNRISVVNTVNIDYSVRGETN